MKTITKLLTATLLLCSFTVVNADVIHVYNCKLNEGKTAEEAITASSAWLVAVRSLEGGDKIEAYHNYPIAANAGDGSFLFVEITPDFTRWGTMNDAYSGSAAEKADQAWGEVASCESASLWNSVKIE
jgi:hypothetical protein